MQTMGRRKGSGLREKKMKQQSQFFYLPSFILFSLLINIYKLKGVGRGVIPFFLISVDPLK